MTTLYDLGATVLIPMKIVSIRVREDGVFYDLKRTNFSTFEQVAEIDIYSELGSSPNPFKDLLKEENDET